jgi:hypothetical protein
MPTIALFIVFRTDRNTATALKICTPVSNKYLFINDPSAGSPTETLLRLLLPLSIKVYRDSLHDVI